MYTNFFQEQQKYLTNLSNSYKEFCEKMLGGYPFAKISAFPTIPSFAPFLTPMQDYYKAYTENMEKMINMQKNNIPAPVAQGFKSYADNIPGMDIYKKFFDLWQDMVKNPSEMFSTFAPKYNELITEVIKKFIPRDSLQIFSKPTEIMSTAMDYYNKFMAPWMEIDKELLNRVCCGDSKAYIEFFKVVNEKYDESFGKVFNVMGLGLNREDFEEQMQLYSGYNKVMFAAAELMAMVMDTLKDAAEDVFKKYNEMLASDEEIKSFKDFYSIWFKSNEDTILRLFNTDEFSKVYGKFADQCGKFMIMMNKAYEKALSFLPIPTKTDMDSLYKTVYELRKEVRSLKKELVGLQK